MVKVKTGPFICSCWAKCILGSQLGGIAPDCVAKAREPICEGKCHHVTPPSISASFSLWLVTCGALQLQLFFCVFTSVSHLLLSLQLVSLSCPSSCPSFCLSNHFLLTTEAFSFSTFCMAQQPSKCYSHNLACFGVYRCPFLFHYYLFIFTVIIEPQLSC